MNRLDGVNIKGQKLEQAIKSAGFDYEVEKQNIKINFNGSMIESDDHQALINNKTGKVLSVVSPRYKLVQPREVLEFYQGAAEKAGFQLDRVGVNDGGQSVWAIAATPDKEKVLDEEIRQELVMSTSFNTKTATNIKIQVLCLACLNGMTRRSTKEAVRVKHSQSFNPDEVKADLGLIQREYAGFKEIIESLAETKVSDRNMVRLIHAIVGKKEKIEDESTRTQNIIERIYKDTFHSPGSDLTARKNSLWGLYNGFTYYVDHDSNFSTSSKMFGAGDKLKNDAMSILLDVAKAEQANRKVEQEIEQPNALEVLGLV